MASTHSEITPSANGPRRWRWVLGLTILIGLGAGGHSAWVKGSHRGALRRWREPLQGLLAGRDIYRVDQFPTPPIMALVLVPIAHLPPTTGLLTWVGVKVGLLLATLGLLRRSIEPLTGIGEARAALSLGLLAASIPIVEDLTHSNVNLWILFWVVLGQVLWLKERDWSAGLVLGLASCCKLTPTVMVGYWIWKRSWKAAAGWGLGLVLWGLVVPSAFLGMERTRTLTVHWAEQMLGPIWREGKVETEQINQSLTGLVHRLLTPAPAIRPDDGRPPIRLNLVNGSPVLAQRCLAGLLLTQVVILGIFCRPGRPRQCLATWQELGLACWMMLLWSERSWRAHYVLALPSMAVLWAGTDALSGWRRGLTRGLWLAAALVFLSVNKDLLGETSAKLVLGYGAYVWAGLLGTIGHYVILHQWQKDRA